MKPLITFNWIKIMIPTIQIISCLLLLVSSTNGDQPDPSCLQCICQASSNCDTNNLRCPIGSGLNSYCGPYQISRYYWEDGNGIGYDFETCTNLKACAERVIINYMKKYSRDCNGDGFIDCLDYAAIHRMGVDSCSDQSLYSSEYWQAFSQTQCVLNPPLESPSIYTYQQHDQQQSTNLYVPKSYPGKNYATYNPGNSVHVNGPTISSSSSPVSSSTHRLKKKKKKKNQNRGSSSSRRRTGQNEGSVSPVPNHSVSRSDPPSIRSGENIPNINRRVDFDDIPGAESGFGISRAPYVPSYYVPSTNGPTLVSIPTRGSTTNEDGYVNDGVVNSVPKPPRQPLTPRAIPSSTSPSHVNSSPPSVSPSRPSNRPSSRPSSRSAPRSSSRPSIRTPSVPQPPSSSSPSSSLPVDFPSYSPSYIPSYQPSVSPSIPSSPLTPDSSSILPPVSPSSQPPISSLTPSSSRPSSRPPSRSSSRPTSSRPSSVSPPSTSANPPSISPSANSSPLEPPPYPPSYPPSYSPAFEPSYQPSFEPSYPPSYPSPYEPSVNPSYPSNEPLPPTVPSPPFSSSSSPSNIPTSRSHSTPDSNRRKPPNTRRTTSSRSRPSAPTSPKPFIPTQPPTIKPPVIIYETQPTSSPPTSPAPVQPTSPTVSYYQPETVRPSTSRSSSQPGRGVRNGRRRPTDGPTTVISTNPPRTYTQTQPTTPTLASTETPVNNYPRVPTTRDNEPTENANPSTPSTPRIITDRDNPDSGLTERSTPSSSSSVPTLEFRNSNNEDSILPSNPRPPHLTNITITISDQCLSCLCESTESCSNKGTCSNPEGPCGPLQVTYGQWVIAGQPKSNFQKCASSLDCSRGILRRYYAKHGVDCNLDSDVNCVDFALIHKYGLDNCKVIPEDLFKSGYWLNFENCYGFDRK